MLRTVWRGFTNHENVIVNALELAVLSSFQKIYSSIVYKRKFPSNLPCEF